MNIGHWRDDISGGHVTTESCVYKTYPENPLNTRLNAFEGLVSQQLHRGVKSCVDISDRSHSSTGVSQDNVHTNHQLRNTLLPQARRNADIPA